MSKFMSQDAINYLSERYGEIEGVWKGWRGRNEGLLGWRVDFGDDREIYIIEDGWRFEYDEANERIPKANHKFDHVCLYTMVEGNYGDEEFGLIAYGNYEKIHNLIEAMKEFKFIRYEQR